MSKLTFKTIPPRKGAVHHKIFMTHELKNIHDKLPPIEIQREAHEKVGEVLRKLIIELSELGYDETKVGFYIHY